MSDQTAVAPEERALIDLESQYVVQNYGRGEHTLRAARAERAFISTTSRASAISISSPGSASTRWVMRTRA